MTLGTTGCERSGGSVCRPTSRGFCVGWRGIFLVGRCSFDFGPSMLRSFGEALPIGGDGGVLGGCLLGRCRLPRSLSRLLRTMGGPTVRPC